MDLAQVAAAPVEDFAHRFEHKGIDFARALTPVLVIGDSGRLEQIVVNLLSNALRYTEPGGEVRMRVGPDMRGAVIEVIVAGLGIAAEDIPHVFTRGASPLSANSGERTTASSRSAANSALVRLSESSCRVLPSGFTGSTDRVLYVSPADSFRAVFLTAGRLTCGGIRAGHVNDDPSASSHEPTSPRLQVPPQESERCRRIVVVEDANKLKQLCFLECRSLAQPVGASLRHLSSDRSSRCRPCRSVPPLRPARPCRR